VSTRPGAGAVEEVPSDDHAALQARYYADTAAHYDSAHSIDREHDIALGFATAMFEPLGIRSVLDVGTGTGRTIRALDKPDLQVVGVEPVAELLERALAAGVPAHSLVRGSGFQLPFPDGSFDAVCELAVLHHVPDPEPMVREMTRVARKAIFISDDNRFGRSGRWYSNLAKLAIYRSGMWPAFWKLKTKGKGYQYTEDDGISYSYSVFDSYRILAEWADRVVMVPTAQAVRSGWLHPLLTSSHVLVMALKGDPQLPWLRTGNLGDLGD